MSRPYILVGSLIVVGLLISLSQLSFVGNANEHLDLPSQATDGNATTIFGVHEVSSESLVQSSAPQAVDAGRLDDPRRLSSEEQQYLKKEVLRGVFFDERGREQYVAAVREALSDRYGPEEAGFYADLLAAKDWPSAKELIESRTEISGQNYDTQLMKMGLQFGEISADEIQMLVNRGTPLPQDAINRLAEKGQVDTIVSLAGTGLLWDLNARNRANGRNALSEIIVRISQRPYKYSPSDAADTIEKLTALGIESTNSSGGRDALDYALDGINASNAEVKLSMVRVLLNRGLILSKAQEEVINNIPNLATSNGY